MSFLVSVLFWLSSDLESVENTFLQHRLALRSCELSLHATGFGGLSRRTSPDSPVDQKFDLFFDDARVRCDRVGADDELVATVSLTPTEKLSYKPSASESGLPRIAKREKRSDSGVASVGLFNALTEPPIPNPRALGALTTTLLGHACEPADGLVGNRTFATKRSDVREIGESIVRVEYENDRVKATVDIDRTRDFNPVSMEVVNGEKRYITRCELHEVDGYGWFPGKIVFDFVVDGRTLCHQDIDVIVRSANTELKDSVFTLRGMGVPDGYPTADLLAEDQREMQRALSADLRKYHQEKAAEMIGPAGRPAGKSHLAILVGSVLLIAGLALGARQLRRS